MRKLSSIGAVAVALGAIAALAHCSATAQKADVPVAGAISASNLEPDADEVIHVYLNATVESATETLRLELKLPNGVTLVAGETGVKEFKKLARGETATLAARVRCSRPTETRIIGAAILHDTRQLKMSRAFVLTLNAAPPVAAQTHTTTNKAGEPLIIFPGKR